MFTIIDKLNNKITMYRLVVYYLLALLAIAAVFGGFGILPYTPLAILFSTAVLIVSSWVTNALFGKVWKTVVNQESFLITALILALIISPPNALNGGYMAMVGFYIWAGILSEASKYIFAYGRKHLFNPAAIAVVITAFAIGQSATWWVGTLSLLPFVIIGGIFLTRKVQRFDLVLSFLVVTIVGSILATGSAFNLATSARSLLVETPCFFLAFVMLTEPLTTPPGRNRRITYGAIVGALFIRTIHVGTIFSTPELALCVGNIFSYLVSPKRKYMLTLKSSAKIATDTGEFVYTPDYPIAFRPGQYLEWTLATPKIDSRGNRRYFTIASSPTEKEVRLGVKFSPNASSFKRALSAEAPGEQLMVGQLSGDFTLPRDPTRKLVFIAGGIGITPFRSMLKYLVDTGEKRDIVLVYSNKTIGEIAYTDIFDQAYDAFNLKTVCTLTDLDHVPREWHGNTGFVNAEMIAKEIPDYAERMFFVSGPHSLVAAAEKMLSGMSVPSSQIKTDFFPGFV